VGDYASTPEIFWTLFFLVVAFVGYNFGQFPARPALARFLHDVMVCAKKIYGFS
jgi:hypothetical protein